MSQPKLRVAVVGVGHLGQAHARVLSALPEVDLVGVADANLQQAETVAARHQTQAYSHFGALLERVDAACIVVPTCLHHKVATAFLERGIHLLIEKPLAPTVEQADEMAAAARRNGCVVQVGHIERFNPAFEALIKQPMTPRLIESDRHGPFTGRSADIGAVLDLMVHDLDLVRALDRSAVVGVEAMGVSVFGGHEDMVKSRLRFASGLVADLTACRIAPTAKRTMRVWSAEGFAGIDFASRKLTSVRPSDELRRNGLDVSKLDVGAREAIKAEIFGKHLEVHEQTCDSPFDQLTNELRHFVDCVRTGSTPRVSVEDGRDVVALACRVVADMQERGKLIGEVKRAA